MSDTASIEIDGRTLEAPRGAMIIEVADRHGIHIPRFCYHRKLSIAANCRMCLVEVEKAPKPLPACATPVMDGMKVRTASALAAGAQKAVMEFLLINHPLDCPICDQGGECELQDVAMGYGRGVSRFSERKRVVADKNLGPLIATDMTRCIHCTRCVRFGEEIAGMPELGATGRGEHMEIGTFVEQAVDSEMSGNVIDVCPVGALTSKPFRFQARAWEMGSRDTVAPHDAVGSNVHVHVMGGRVKRVVPRENEAVNEVWISDRDRFSYEGLYDEERLLEPMIRRNGEWSVCGWEEALAFASRGLRSLVSRHGADAFGTLVSPNASVEEAYLLQKMVRGLGVSDIDHRLRDADFSDQEQAPLCPSLGCSLAEVETRDAVLLVGAWPRKEVPILNHRLRKASLAGARVMVLNPADYEFNFRVDGRIVVSPDAMVDALASVLSGSAAPAELCPGVREVVDGASHSEDAAAIASTLADADHAALLLGPMVARHPEGALLRALARALASATGASLGQLTEGANAAGAWLAGALPHRGPGGRSLERPGRDARSMLRDARPGYLLFGIEPELDCGDPALALSAMRGADFVAVFTAYRSEAMSRYADVMLPIAPYAENSGTFVNLEGRWQSFEAAVRPPGEARPGWKVLRVMGNVLDLEGFDYLSAEEVRGEVESLVEQAAPIRAAWRSGERTPWPREALCRLGSVPLYAADAIVRRAPALQQTRDAAFAGVSLNSAAAARLGLEDGARATVRQGDACIRLPVFIDDRLPDGCACLPAGVPQAAALGPDIGPMHVTPA